MAILLILVGGNAMADPRECVTYDFAGNELCVSENGVEGGDYFVPGETQWFCVTYTFSGAQICVSSDGQIQNY
jgi:hypothetical protein